MKIYVSLLVFVLFMSKGIRAQTLQTVVDNGNTTTSAVKFFGRTDFGEAYDPIAYGAVQITRPANLNPKFHLFFIREGQMVYGMGFLYNSNVFAIQSGSDNKSLKGLFTESIQLYTAMKIGLFSTHNLSKDFIINHEII